MADEPKKTLVPQTNADGAGLKQGVLEPVVEHYHDGLDSPKIKTSDLNDDLGALASAAYADGPGTNTVVPGGFTATKIPIASANFATGITYDPGNKRFKIITAGKYLVIGVVFYSNPTTANVSYQTMIYLNGVQTVTAYVVPPVLAVTVAQVASRILNLAVNDYIELWGQTNAAGNNNVSGTLSYLSIAKV